jgi:outer membrane protein assembly factor BamB
MVRAFLTLFVLFCFLNISAQEIAQWRGENRDGIYNETGLLKEWPEEGPQLLWHFDDLGDGHASASVTSKVVYTAGTLDDMGYVFAFDHDGNLLWKTEYGKEWSDSYPGVRTTPMIFGDKLYTMSSFGKVVCMNASSGKILWTVDVLNDYDGRNITWGVTENLVIHENVLFCTPGGTKANVIALDKDSGKLVWKSDGNQEKSAYCSPLVIKLAEKNLFVTQTGNSILGIDADKGKLLWRHSQVNQYSVHANTPLYHDNQLYCVSGYGKGGVMLKISDDGRNKTELWRNSDLDSRMGGMVLINGRIYGSGDQNRKWFCLDWKTGEVLYSSSMMGKGNVIYADGMLYCYSERGNVGLVEPKDNEFVLKGKFRVPYGSDQHWAHLVIHNKRLYVRHGNSLMVYSLAE